jgi:adrenodoxin-NADP+ reductase
VSLQVGVDITIPEMRKFYNAVVLAYGAGKHRSSPHTLANSLCTAGGERDLDIPGNRLREVHSARTFVNWYNGHPEFAQVPIQ